MKDRIKKIQQEKDFERKFQLFQEVSLELSSGGKEKAAQIKPLLTDISAQIRRETAFLLDYWGVELNEEESFQFLLAIQDVEALKSLADHNQKARDVLLAGMQDRNLRLREKILRVFHLSDCRTEQEKALYFYCRGDYTALIQICQKDDMLEWVVNLLNRGILPEFNTPYHRRQCAMTLKQLGFLAEEQVPRAQKRSRTALVEPAPPAIELNPSPLQQFLDRLNQKGLCVDGEIMYPTIHQVGTTNRITYKHPGVQGWSKQKRLEKITPPEGMVLYSFDFKEIEPRLLLNFLVQNFWLSIDDVHVDDVYRLFDSEDRNRGKRFLNAVINGAVPTYFPQEEKAAKIFDAIQEFRMELVEEVRGFGYVETLAGNHLYVSPDEENFNGKVMNRLVQGSASDFFNDAVVSLQAYLDLEQKPAEIILLLFDEVWVAVEKGKEKQLSSEIQDFLNQMAARWHLPLKIDVRKQRLGKRL